MATPYEYVVEIKTLLTEGWSANAIHKHFKEGGRKLSVNTIYKIKKGEFEHLHLGKNKWLLAGEGERAKALEDKVHAQLEEVRDDVVKRTTVLEQTADMEILSRLTNDNKRANISTGDLTRVSDSAAKRKALAEDRPTDIFKIFDEEMSNKEIIEIIQQQNDDDTTDTNPSEGTRGSEEEQREVSENSQALPSNQQV